MTAAAVQRGAHAAATDSLRGSQALGRLIAMPAVGRVLDIGSGEGLHAAVLRDAGLAVETVDLAPPADHVTDFMDWDDGEGDFDAIWACHVLEHQPDPNAFLRHCLGKLRPGGRIVVTVPPLKHEIVGGHVTLWNAGLLLYQLILAGFDCRRARVGTYASGPGYPVYNISAIAERPAAPLALPALKMDRGDIEALAPFFPVPVRHGFDGRLADIDW